MRKFVYGMAKSRVKGMATSLYAKYLESRV